MTSALRELESVFGPRAVVSSDAGLMVYECHAFVATKTRPLAVVFPNSTNASPPPSSGRIVAASPSCCAALCPKPIRC